MNVTKHVAVRMDPPASTARSATPYRLKKVHKFCEQNPISFRNASAPVAHLGYDLIPAEAATAPTLPVPESTAHANLDEQKSSRLEPAIPEGTPASDEAFKPDGPPKKSGSLDPLRSSNHPASTARRSCHSRQHLLRGANPAGFSWGNAQVTKMPVPPGLD